MLTEKKQKKIALGLLILIVGMICFVSLRRESISTNNLGDIRSSGTKTLIFHLQDKSGTPIANTITGKIFIEKVGTPSENYIEYTDSNGNATFSGVFDNGDWKIIGYETYNSEEFVVYNETLSFSGTQTTFYASGVANLTRVKLTVTDYEGEPIEGVYVRMVDNGAPSNYFDGYTDSNGIVRLDEVYNSPQYWNITMQYTVGTKVYTIKTDNNFEVKDLHYYELLQEKIESNTNFTQVDLYCADSNLLELDNWWLYNANVTLHDPYTGENITSYYSNGDGLIKLKLPRTKYNFSVIYQDKPRQFTWNTTGSPSYNKQLDFTNSYGTTNMTLTITEQKTEIIINKDPQWMKTGWNVGEGQVNHTDSPPRYIKMYYGDAVTLEFLFRTVPTHNQLDSDAGNWTIKRDGVAVNSSSSVDCNSSGIFTLSIFSTDYYAGTYDFSLRIDGATAGDCQDAFYFMTIYILNFTTQLVQVDPAPGTPIDVILDTNLTIQFNYSSILPESAGIDGTNILQYEILNTANTGYLTNLGGGIYKVNFNCSLANGITEDQTYTIHVFGNKTNYDWVEKSINFDVIKKPTKMSLIIDSDKLIGPNYMKISRVYNLSFLINFTDRFGNPFSSYADVVINVGVNGSSNNLNDKVYPTITPGIYNVTFNVSEYYLSYYQIEISCSKPHHTTNLTTLQVDLIDYWRTELVTIEPPSGNEPWGNNISFIVLYRCIETPRIGTVISDAVVSGINLTLSGNPSQGRYLDSSDLGTLWGYIDLKNNGTYGPGYYLLWFNNSVVEANDSDFYYITPKIRKGEYDQPTSVLFTTISEIDSTVIAYLTGQAEVPLSYIEFSYNQNGGSVGISVKYNVTDSDSIYYGDNILNALINYEILNNSQGGAIVSSGTGYSFNVPTNVIGDYTVNVNATLGNYTYSETSFVYNIIGTPINDPTITIPDEFKSGNAIKTSIGENITFTAEYTVADLDIKIYMENELVNTSAYKITSTQFNCTFPASNWTEGTYNLKIVATKIGYTKNEYTIVVFILTEWKTRLSQVEASGIFAWGDNISFYLKYTCDEAPRQGWLLNNSQFTSLHIEPKEGGEPNIILAISELGTKWGYIELKDNPNYGPGVYQVWFMSDILNVSQKTTFFITAFADVPIYEAANERVIIWLEPIETSFVVNADERPGGPLSEVYVELDETLTIKTYWNVTGSSNSYYGTSIENGNVYYRLINISDSSVYRDNTTLTDLGNGYYGILLNISDVGDFRAEFYAIKENYTSASYTFNIYAGANRVKYNVLLDVNEKTSSFGFKAAHGENATFNVNFTESQRTMDIFLNITLENSTDVIEINQYIYNNTPGIFTITFETINFALGTYTVRIQGNITGFKSKVVLLNLEIIDYWRTIVTMIQPPYMYHWNEIGTFIIKYEAAEYPRIGDAWALADANISQLILNERDGPFSAVYSWDTINKIWNFTNLKNDPSYGPGYYSIWFNTSVLPVDDLTGFDITPIIYQSVYNQSSYTSNIFVEPIYTTLTPLIPEDLNSKLKRVEVFLYQNATIYAKINVTDVASEYYGRLITDSTVTLEVYKVIGQPPIYSTSLVYNSTLGYYIGVLNGSYIGTYTIRIIGQRQNFTVETEEFTFVVKPLLINYDYKQAIDEKGYVTIAGDQGLKFQIYFEDNIYHIPLTDATVKVNIKGVNYTLTPVAGQEGLYQANIPASVVKQLEENQVHRLYIYVEKENYDTLEFYITLDLEWAKDPIFGIPYRYWAIVFGTIGALFAALGARKAYIRAHTPLEIKLIDRAYKIVRKNKKAPKSRIARNVNEEIYMKFAKEWRAIDLDLKDSIKGEISMIEEGKKKGEEEELYLFGIKPKTLPTPTAYDKYAEEVPEESLKVKMEEWENRLKEIARQKFGVSFEESESESETKTDSNSEKDNENQSSSSLKKYPKGGN
ncbi:MAG: hypothetical protein ACTSRZ_06925 [Promethearchaeota archaeon]